jgi:hypothetical protein
MRHHVRRLDRTVFEAGAHVTNANYGLETDQGIFCR